MMKKIAKILLLSLILTTFTIPTYAASSYWVKTSKGWTYYENNKQYLHSWRYFDNEHTYYFNSEGIMQTGWVNTSKGPDTDWHYFNSDGTMHRGWLLYNNNWYYINDITKTITIGNRTIDGKSYHFNKDGILDQGIVDASVPRSNVVNFSSDGSVFVPVNILPTQEQYAYWRSQR